MVTIVTETNDLLKEILKWQRVIGDNLIKNKIKEKDLLKDKKQILAYYNSDGNNSIRKIAKIVKLSNMTVQRLWKEWIKEGLAEPSDKYKGRRCKRIFELNELGLKLP